MLHIVQSSPTRSPALETCLLSCDPDDVLVFMADGVYAVELGTGPHWPKTFYVLAEDAFARGLRAENRDNWIDYSFFIALAADHETSINWG